MSEYEKLDSKWIDEHSETFREIEESMVPLDKQYIDKVKVQKILVPKREEVEEGRARLIVGFDGGTESYYATDIGDALDFLTGYDARFTVSKEPMIPKFVAEFLIGKEDYMLYELFDDEWLYEEHNRVAKWLYDNDELTNKQREIDLVMARDRGFTVEEEPLYRARLKVITDEFISSYLRTQSSDAENRLKTLEIGSKYIHEDYRHLSEFTEDELKILDIWDSEQWEVEELEE